MTRLQTTILTLLVILTNKGLSQGLPTTDKKVIAVYSGGRFGFSGLSLTLYSDSSYIYTSWTHTGESYTDKGIFARHKSKINLRSDTLITTKGILGYKSFVVFDNRTYRIKGTKILLYSRREELFDRHDFYSSYYTLHLTDTSGTK